MRRTVSARRMRLLGRGVASGLLLAFTGCSEPVHVAWNETESIIGPVLIKSRVSPPQGSLTVYSESYVHYSGDWPRTNRRPVEVYTVDGQLVAGEENPFGQGPLHFALSPGHYIVVSESHGQLRQVQVDIQEGRETVVAEAQLDEAPLVAASQPRPTTHRMPGRSGLSR